VKGLPSSNKCVEGCKLPIRASRSRVGGALHSAWQPQGVPTPTIVCRHDAPIGARPGPTTCSNRWSFKISGPGHLNGSRVCTHLLVRCATDRLLIHGQTRGMRLPSGLGARPRTNREPRNREPPTLPFHRARSEAGNDLFLGEQVESDGWDHRQADEGQDLSPVGAVLALELHNSERPWINGVVVDCH
jgi:hypothetical protein